MNLRPASFLSIEPLRVGMDSIDCARITLPRHAANTSMVRDRLNIAWRALHSLDGRELSHHIVQLTSAVKEEGEALDPRLRDEVETLSVIDAISRDRVERIPSAAHIMLAKPGVRRLKNTLLTLVRFDHLRSRNFARYYKAARPAPSLHQPLSRMMSALNLSMDALVEAEQLRFKLAERLAKEAMDVARDDNGTLSISSCLASYVVASIAYEQGDIEEAQRSLRHVAPCYDQIGAVESAWLGACVAAKVSVAGGNSHAAVSMMEKMRALGQELECLTLSVRASAELIAIHLSQGREECADQVFCALKETVGMDRLSLDGRTWPFELARCRMALARGDYMESIHGLVALKQWAIDRNYLALGIRSQLLLAGSFFMSGQETEAQLELLAALEAGVTAGLFRTFVDEMQLIALCLRRLLNSLHADVGFLRPYICSLLAAKRWTACTAAKASRGHATKMKEALSSKETVILRLISRGLSNKCIARELHIAPETVKSHAKRIFVKLSTRTRAEAVARATTLGLI